MGEYEPEDSRVVTQSDHQAPGEPPRTGPREDAARREAQRDGESAADDNETRGIDAQREQYMNTAAVERGEPIGQGLVADEAEDAAGDPARLRRDADRPLGGS